MSPLTSALGKMAAFTAKGAAITLGSTVFSCVMACYIERGANRMVYRFFPHKFAHVETANGITQEQLDAVRICYAPEIVAQIAMTTPRDTEATSPTILKERQEVQTLSTSRKESPSQENYNRTIFWTERREEEGAKTLSKLVAINLPSHEILACAMTC